MDAGASPRHKGKAGARRVRRTVLRLALLLGCAGVAVFVAGYALTPIPDENDVAQVKASIVYYADGERELGTFAAENRIPVRFDDVPEHVRDAVVAAENKDFWVDQGVDPIGLAGAVVGNATGTSTGGASTITQQYVKQLYLTDERTIERKVEELFIALKVNQKLSKPKILQGYLNISYFGRGALGIQTAARAYFDKDVADLTVTEGAVLASMLKAPADYDPAENDGDTERLEWRFRYVLNNMAEIGAVEPEFAETAELPDLAPVDDEQAYEGPDGYLLAEVERELNELGYSDQQLDAGGLRATTTLDVAAQRAMNRALGPALETGDSDGLYAGGVAIGPGTGEVLAMYGGEDYLKRQWNDATQSTLEAGTALDPFGLAAGYENGYLPPAGAFAAVEASRYWPTGIASGRIDPRLVVDAAVRAGIPADTDGLRTFPELALVAPIDMANAYATLAADGRRAEHHLIAKVTTDSGKVLYERDVRARGTLDPKAAHEVRYALLGMPPRPDPRSTASTTDLSTASMVGGYDDKTAWYSGYTERLAMSVAFYRDADGDGGKEPLPKPPDVDLSRVLAALPPDTR